MRCRRCASTLERPGDHCLVCRSENTDVVVLEVGTDRATLTMLGDESVVGTSTVTTVPEDGGESRVVARRNYVGRIADEIRRKRPDAVYATGDRDLIRRVRDELRYEFYRVPDDDPVAATQERLEEPALAVVETPPDAKIGGSHTTLVGGRTGRRAIRTVAGHPHVKKIIPGPIDASGTGSRTGTRAKVTRAGTDGNIRLLIRDGSSVQENRIVTTAGNREMGERIATDLNEALSDEGMQ